MEIDTRKEIRERIRKRYGIAEPGLLPTPTSKDVKEKSNPTYTGEPRGQQPEDNFKMTFFGKTVFSGNLPDWLIGSEKENPDQRLIRAIAEERNKPLTFVDTNAPPYLRKEIPLGITVGELSDELGERKGKLSTQGFENVQGSFRQSTKQLDRGLSGSGGVVGSAVDVAEGLATGIFSALMMPMNFFSPTAQKMGKEMTNLGAPPVVGETFGEYAPNLLYPNPIKLSTAMFISDKINKGVENSLMDSDMLEANKQRIQTGVSIASFLASYYGAGKIGEAGHSLFSKENIPKTIKTAPQEVKGETRTNQVNDRAKLKQRLNEIKDVKTKEAIKEKQQIIRDLVKENEKKVSETKPLEVKPNEVVDTKPETPIGTPKEVTPENNYNQAKQLVDETISLKEKRKERNEHLSDKDEITLSSYKIIKAKLDEGKSASEILDGLHKEYSEKYQELKKRDIEENGELPSDINVSTERINGIKKNPELLIIENAISEVAHSGLFGEGRNNWDYKPKQVTPEVKTIESNVEKPLDQNITISQDKVKTINGESPSTRRSPEINQIRVDKTKDTKSYADIKKVDPDKEVTIYRAIGGGKGRIEAGDFIATDREIAKFYARDILGQRGEGKVTIVSKKVLASEIKLHPDHQAIGVENEFIYRPINPEVQNAKTIRSDEGQVPQGRTTLEGSKSKSSEDLQQPPQEKSGNTQEQVIEVKPIKEFKTEEGKFTNYDISAEHKDRPDMFTVLKDKNGYVIRNAFVPDNIQRQGIATDFYEKMNKESLQETGKPLRSSPAREMPSGEMRVEMTPDAIGLWDSFVEKGLAEKISDRNYKFKEPGTETPKSEAGKQQYEIYDKALNENLPEINNSISKTYQKSTPEIINEAKRLIGDELFNKGIEVVVKRNNERWKDFNSDYKTGQAIEIFARNVVGRANEGKIKSRQDYPGLTKVETPKSEAVKQPYEMTTDELNQEFNVYDKKIAEAEGYAKKSNTNIGNLLTPEQMLSPKDAVRFDEVRNELIKRETEVTRQNVVESRKKRLDTQSQQTIAGIKPKSKQTEVKPTGISTIDRLRKEAKAEPEMTDAQFKEVIKNLPKDKQRTVIIDRQIKKSINEGIERNKKAPMGFNPLEYKESIKLGAYHLKNGVTKFADWSAQMIKDLGEKIKPHLLRIWAAIKNLGTDLGKIAIDKIGGIIESKYNPARPLKIVSGDLFRQRFEGIKKISDEVQKSGLEIPEETFLKKVERLFADKLNRGETFIKEAEKIQPISDANNFKMQAELYNGRAKDLIDKRSDSILNEETGFLKRLNNAGLSIDDLGEYLLGRHAKERNSFIETKYKKKNGSGITDIEANKILGKWEDTGIEEFADGMNKMVEQTRQNLLDAGIISQKTYDILKNQYQFYVPLKGTMESIETGSMSKGFSVESTGIKKAKGRQSISDNPVIRIIMDANDADIRIEKNKVMKSFHDFATQFPSDAWNISKRKPFTTIGKNQLGVYINGEQEVITIKDAPLLRGLKNLGVERGLKFLDHFNSYLRAVNTYYNPEFLVNNFTRDAQTALINITGEKSIGLARKVTKDVPAMMKDIWKGERGGSSKWFSEYKEDGGKMSWLEYKTPQELADTFAKQVRRFQGKGKIKEAFISTEKFISDLNDTIENAFRVSVYKNLRESGMSREQAASYGKGLTVNFNRKGEYGRALNSAYLFWNASMQGSVRILKALGSPRTRKIVAGLAGISAALNLLNRSVDEQGYDNIPDWEKDSNWIFMTGDGKYLKIRQPYGYNVFSVLGNITGDAISGKKDIGELGGRLLSATTDAFNPFGQSGSIGQFFAPTILDPIIQWSENKKFSRAPIRKEQPFFQPKKPNSQLYLQSVRPLSKGFTDWLNKTTGGNEIEQGLLDINPSDVDFWIDFAGGGTGKFISNSINTGTELISKGDFPDIKNIPFVRSNFGSVSGQKQTKSIYDRYNESSRTKFDEEERNKFIKDVQNGILKKEINPDEGKRLIKSFIKGQSNLRR